tara:strand:+ start:2582 stop:3010 length:429 start_codon:yes stop_codon:yes gene_type:complete
MNNVIHVNQHILRKNLFRGGNEPCIISRTYKGPTYHRKVQIISGEEVCATVEQTDSSSISVKYGNKTIKVNAANIRHNINSQIIQPVLDVYENGSLKERINELDFKDSCGKIVAKMIYSPHKPLSCGARVYIRSDSKYIIAK